MPIKLREAKGRRAPFSPEVIELFLALEATRPGHRDYQEKSKRLARLLGLVAESWTRNTVTDRSSGPHHPEGCLAFEDWFRCRAVREALLQQVRLKH